MIETAERRKLVGTTKECLSCGRDQPSIQFTFQKTDDGLSLRCRTCTLWRSKTTPPTLEQILAFEEEMDALFSEAAHQVADRHKQSVEDALADHRAEFEQLMATAMRHLGLLNQWYPPIWLHKTSVLG